MRAVLIFNPTSGISTVTERRMSPEDTERTIVEGLRACGIDPQLQYTTIEDAGEVMARRAVEAGEQMIIAAGGDGTVHAVANAMIGTQSVLGIIATGTMNNLAHSLNIPDTIPAACTAIANGVTRSIDVGVINDHIFIEVAGIGLEAELFPAAEEFKSPGLLSTIRGLFDGIKILYSFKPAHLRVDTGQGRRRPYPALQITICNAPFYGVHFNLGPEILMDDGLLDVFIYRQFSKLEYLLHTLAVSKGQSANRPELQHLQVRSMHITSSEPVAIQVDGQPLGYTPAIVKGLPGALRVRVSRKEAPGLREVSSSEDIQLISNENPSYQ